MDFSSLFKPCPPPLSLREKVKSSWRTSRSCRIYHCVKTAYSIQSTVTCCTCRTLFKPCPPPISLREKVKSSWSRTSRSCIHAPWLFWLPVTHSTQSHWSPWWFSSILPQGIYSHCSPPVLTVLPAYILLTNFLSFKSAQISPAQLESPWTPPTCPISTFRTPDPFLYFVFCYITYFLNKLWNYYVDCLPLLECKTCIGKEFFSTLLNDESQAPRTVPLGADLGISFCCCYSKYSAT